MRTGVIMIGKVVIGVGPAVSLRIGLGVLVRTPAVVVGTLASALLKLVVTLAGVPKNIVMVDHMVDHIPMRVKIMTRPITRKTLKIMIGRMETSTPRMKIALKILI